MYVLESFFETNNNCPISPYTVLKRQADRRISNPKMLSMVLQHEPESHGIRGDFCLLFCRGTIRLGIN